jgi:hypothetical protein
MGRGHLDLVSICAGEDLERTREILNLEGRYPGQQNPTHDPTMAEIVG